MTLNAVISLILAALGLILLIWGLNKILGFGCMTTATEQAKGEIDKFSNFLNNLSSGEMNSYILLSPEEWWLVSFTINDPKPSDVSNLPHVICICQKKDCKELHFCREISKPIFENEANLKIKIDIKQLTIINQEKFYNLTLKPYAPYQNSNTPLDTFFSQNYRYKGLTGLGQCIEDASKSSKVPVSLIIAVAVHESAGGTSQLSKEKCPNGPATFSNNLFGITKGSRAGQACKWPTSECLTQTEIEEYRKQGNLDTSSRTCSHPCEEKICTNVFREFLAFPDRCGSVKKFVELISTSSYYKKAMQNTGNPLLMVDSLIHTEIYKCGIDGKQECSYATDPQWAKNVKSIVIGIKTVMPPELGFA